MEFKLITQNDYFLVNPQILELLFNELLKLSDVNDKDFKDVIIRFNAITEQLYSTEELSIRVVLNEDLGRYVLMSNDMYSTLLLMGFLHKDKEVVNCYDSVTIECYQIYGFDGIFKFNSIEHLN